MMHIPDEFYKDGVCYLVDKSPLSFIKDQEYRKLFPQVEILEMLNFSFNKGRMTNVNYYTTWLIQDSMLYLRDVCFQVFKGKCISKDGKEAYDFQFPKDVPGEERYTVMESFTGHKFKHCETIPANTIPESAPVGSMFASWVNGDLYIKAPCAHEDKNKYDDWRKAPVIKLSFREGKLVLEEEID